MAPNSGTPDEDALAALDAFAAQLPSTRVARSNDFSFLNHFNNLIDADTTGSLPPNPPPPNPPPPNPPPPRRSYARISPWPVLGALTVAVAIWAYTTLIDPRVVASQCPRHCDIALSFPLPQPVNQTAHQAGLVEFGHEEEYQALVAGQSDFSSSLHTTSQELNKLLNRPQSSTHIDEIVAFGQQLTGIATKATKMVDSYLYLRLIYKHLNATAVEESEALRLSSFQQYAVSAGPWSLPMFGWDSTKWYWDPWMDKQRKAQKVQSGLRALNMELETLDWIKRALHQLDHNIQHIVDMLALRSVGRDNKSIKGIETDWGSNWLRNMWGTKPSQSLMHKWIEHYLTYNKQLGILWDELPTLITDKDKVIVIRVRNDWC